MGCDSYRSSNFFISFFSFLIFVFYGPPEYNGKATGKHSEILLLTLPVGWVGGDTKSVHLKKLHRKV